MPPRKSGLAGELQARQLVAELGLSSLPIDPFKIAAERGIQCFENKDQASGISGCLVKHGDNFGIGYNANIASAGFHRFTVAHELGHYFIPGHIDVLFADGKSVHESMAGFRSDDQHEREADEFAACLLMPEKLFKAEYNRLGEGLATVEALSALCVTSLTATAIRYAKLTDGLAAIIVSEGDRIQFARMSPALQGLNGISSAQIQKNAGLPHRSATAKFNKDGSNVRALRKVSAPTSLDVWFGSGGSLAWTEDVMGLGDYGRTLTVIWAEQDQVQDMGEDSFEDEEENVLPSQRWRDRS
jgi:Zn-dependent peptidase ImmA (M78 family)